MNILIMAGGTGGHVYPALAVAELLQAQGHQVRWLGTPESFEARVVPQHGIPLDTLSAQRLRGQHLWAKLCALLGTVKACWQARRILRHQSPHVVLGMGGFAAGPGGIAAAWLRIPLVIHEQNAIPGFTNRWLARYATRVLTAFPQSFPATHQAKVVGNPLRAGLDQVPPLAKTTQQPLRLLILGGSLGAQALNDIVPQAIAHIPEEKRPQIQHQAGRGKQTAAQAAYQNLNVQAEVVDYITDMAAAYTQADLVICRSGALTVTELTAVGRPAILVPYPHAVDDHQTQNAAALVQAGAAKLIPQKDLTPERIAAQIHTYLQNPDTLNQMAAQARRIATPQAAEQVATHCIQVAQCS